jgi:hypothetical protein
MEVSGPIGARTGSGPYSNLRTATGAATIALQFPADHSFERDEPFATLSRNEATDRRSMSNWQMVHTR